MASMALQHAQLSLQLQRPPGAGLRADGGRP
jgi:hypothetical protein